MKLVRLSEKIVAFKCPGCRGPQQISVVGSNAWKWNASMENPTFEPSILQKHFNGQEVSKICHSFVRDGKIQFLNDCTHELAGQTVDLPEVTDEQSLFYKVGNNEPSE